MVLVSGVAATVQAAEITYDTWTTNENDSGNYILTINDNTAGKFNFNLTVDPWNAEALGLFIDFGDKPIGLTNVDNGATPDPLDITAVGLSNVSPVGEVAVFNTDTSSDGCGQGCNLQGLSPPVAVPDGQWELVFRLGSQGFDSIQTFSFTTNDFGLTLADFGLAGIRAQQYCDPGDLLPGDTCDGSDKSYGSTNGGPGPEPDPIPEPGSLALLGLGLAGLGYFRRKSQR